MTRILPAYMYGDPSETLDRKRAEDKRAAAPRVPRINRNKRILTDEDLKHVPRAWLTKGE